MCMRVQKGTQRRLRSSSFFIKEEEIAQNPLDALNAPVDPDAHESTRDIVQEAAHVYRSQVVADFKVLKIGGFFFEDIYAYLRQ
jgi:hypothetical protein